MRQFDLSRRLPCGLLLILGLGGACAQSASVPGPETDIYAGTREYRWTFYVPVMSVERREIVVQGPGVVVRSRRFEYEVPGLKTERRKLFPVAEFYCKYPDWQLPNECGVAWRDVYADFPLLTMRREHTDADVAEWTSEERRIRIDVHVREPDFDGQGHQVLLRPVVDVAFQPPPRLVLRGDNPLPRRPQVLDQAHIRQHQPSL